MTSGVVESEAPAPELLLLAGPPGAGSARAAVERHHRLLKRAGRFLLGAPRAVWTWGRQRWGYGPQAVADRRPPCDMAILG